ncbi:MAG: signal peptidase I [Clostridia bacterium]|nr:signal peptidase I [Clostridia bacterium]
MEERTNNILTDIFNGILTALICVVSFLLLVFMCFNFVYVQTPVVGVSMQPLLNPTVETPADSEEFAFVNKYGSISRNNIVVADVPWFTAGSIIKRVVGIPGDLINVKEGEDVYELYVNDELFYTRPMKDNDGKSINKSTFDNLKNFCNKFPDNTYTDGTGKKYIRINEGEYFLLGDNWSESKDCATEGCAKKEEIVGRVDFVIHKKGSYVLQYLGALLKITFTTQTITFC